MTLEKFGGLYQLRIQSAEDLRTVLALPEACWMATSAPCAGLRCDPAFTRYMDTDHDGRIRTDELRNAIRWTLSVLDDHDGIEQGLDSLSLASINDQDPEGRRLHVAVRRVLKNLGHETDTAISLCQVRDLQRIRANASANGDGIIPPSAARTPEVADFIRDIMDTAGAIEDAGGTAGIGRAQLVKFQEDARAYLAWRGQGSIPDGRQKTDIMVWGTDTPHAYEAVERIRGKMDEYFNRCMLLSMDERMPTAMKLADEAVQSMDFSDPQSVARIARAAPMAPPNVQEILDFAGAINPYFRRELTQFKTQVLPRAIGVQADKLTLSEWQAICRIFEPYRKWTSGKQGASVEKLGVARIREYLDGDYIAHVRQLIAEDEAVAPEMAEIGNVEKLILYQHGLLKFANNFVSFPYLYDIQVHSMFQMGTLILGGRELRFNILVEHLAEHKKYAAASLMYILYVEIMTGAGGHAPNMLVATPVTAGDAAGLHKGRRGIFRSTDGNQWDAVVVDVLDNPVSLWESVKMPFVKMGGFMEAQAEKFTSSRYADLEDKVGTEINTLNQSVQRGVSTAGSPSPGPTPAGSNRAGAVRDLLLSGSVSLAALSSAFAFVTKTLSSVSWQGIAIAVTAGTCALLMPLVLMGAFKLRRRNISAVLEASGWAINGTMRLKAGLGHLFTRFADFPEDATRMRGDHVRRLAGNFSESQKRRKRLVFLLLLLIAALIVFRKYAVPI